MRPTYVADIPVSTQPHLVAGIHDGRLGRVVAPTLELLFSSKT